MTLAKQIQQIGESTAGWEDVLVAQAENLVKNFRRERIACQAEWFRETQSRGRPRGRHSIEAWCPLNLFARMHNGSLQIYWQLVYRDRTTRSLGYKHLSKKKTGGYDLRSLLAHAKSFERELVADYEEEAQLQRLRWAQFIRLRRDVGRMAEANRAEGALMKRRRASHI